MANTLDVLVLETRPGAADLAAEGLEAAGHRVARCHDGEEAFPCAGLAHGGCPVEDGTIDVAVTIRSQPRSTPAAHEDGVTCALRNHIPLVVAGKVALNPYEAWAAEVVPGDDVVDAVERAARAPLARHTAVATARLAESLTHRGVDATGATAEVRRVHGGLQVRLRVPTGVEPRDLAMVGVRISAALRELDGKSRAIDVVVEP